jgi:phage xkdN-like protein|nr:MAG TPA: tail assembly chaperone protein [Caudoviricetes sp.]
MSTLYSFLHPVKTTVEKEVIISDRFVQMDEKGNPILDENGKIIPVPFKIRALSQEENDTLIKKSTKVEVKNGQRLEYLDATDYSHRIVVASTIEPDFSSKEMCDAYGVVSPLLVPVKMLNVGEYNRLAAEIQALSNIDAEQDGEAEKN